MSVEFQDNRIKVKSALNDKAIAYLYEASELMTSQTKQNMPPGHWFSQQKNAWKYVVDEDKLEAIIGNPMQQSLWTEFGTGEYALKKDGRKGYWVYVKGSDGAASVSNGGKNYTLNEAKKVVAMLRSKKLDAHLTKGQSAKRPLHNAFTSLKSALIRRAEDVLKGMGS